METNASSAKLERPASAILTTRAGTNNWHGSAFETGRNSGFGVARRREDTFSKAPHLVRNEFGASLGGPVIKNQTAASSFKRALLSNGVRTLVPPHVAAGTRVVIMTDDGSYVERAKD